jgi:hypothetical protein
MRVYRQRRVLALIITRRPVNLYKFNTSCGTNALMSLAEKQALALRDLAVIVTKAKGATTTQIAAPDQPTQYVFEDDRLRIIYSSTTPQAVEVF